MSTLALGRYEVKHGIYPLPTPSQPGQEIIIPHPPILRDVPSPIPVYWHLEEAKPLPEFPLLKRYCLTTDDRSAYLALQYPTGASQTGGLTTSTDVGQALIFILMLPSFAEGPMESRYKIHSTGGLVTFAPSPQAAQTIGSVEVVPTDASGVGKESQIWQFSLKA